MKIACVGDVGVDYYENLKLLKPGGIAFNFACNLVKSSKKNKVSIVALLGDDIFTQKLLQIIKELKINFSHIKIMHGNSPKQNIFLKENGERKFTGYNPGVLTKWKLQKTGVDFICKHDAVFVPLSDGIEHIFNAVKKIKGPIKVVDFSQDYEFADFSKQNNIITKNIKYFDIIFIGGSGKYLKMVEKLAKNNFEKVIVLTLGFKGSISFYQGKIYIQKAMKVRKIVDTTGCGDAFQAGFLASWIEKKDIKTALLKGTKRAASIIKYVGSTPLTLK